MRIEAGDISTLLQLVELDQQARGVPPATAPGRREAICKRVPRALLERYQILLEGGRCPAMVPIERGACTGCHVRLPTMLEYRARRSPAVHECPHCLRMLYAPELLGEEPAPVAGPQKKKVTPRRGAPAAAGERS